MSKNSNVGVVTFITNSPYGSIHKFCPSEDYIDRLEKNKLKNQAYYSKGNHSFSEKHEYNSNIYELHTYRDYFKDNHALNITGYINQESNLYLITKFINHGLIFVVLNMTYEMQISSILLNIEKYVKLIHKNAPNSEIAILLRYPETNKWCILSTDPQSVIQSVKEKFPELIDVLIHPFSYIADYEITYSTFVDIRNVIEKYYSDNSKFISFSPKEQHVAEFLLRGKVFGKKTAYSEKTIQMICKESDIECKSLLDKLVKCGLLNHFYGNMIDKFYFKNGYTEDKIIPVLLNLFNNTSYMKKTMEYGSPARHFVTPYLFRRSIPLEFKNRIAMSDRLILKIIESIKAGRTTLTGKKLYLRRYDIGEFSKNNDTSLSMRFVYN